MQEAQPSVISVENIPTRYEGCTNKVIGKKGIFI